ncbi:MAG TPA: ABC transporter substrate-binding protein [Acetobacteraceae bacterium]|jgi:glucose/mannose transport system substrate-binding protein|nr:ABC transporter substrate-binding protein [Acetobacteraceae bacterium]
MLQRQLVASAFAALLTLAGHAKADELRAEVIHWWTSGGESAAVKVFADQFNAAGGIWVDTAIAGGANARTAAINRTVGGSPPSAMQFNTGKQFDDLVENDLLTNVDAQEAAQSWKAILPAAFVQAVTRDGHAYAVPVNIHGQNWLFYSNDALARAGVQPPANWDELFPALDKLKAAGLIPLAFGGQKNWERNLFNNVMVGRGGRDMFIAVWGKRDVATVKGPEFRKVAESYKRLRDYVDPGSPGRNWNDATSLVIQGKAGMQFMGDWAKGEFTAAGLTPGKDYGCTVLSDHGMAYVMGGDVFAFPRLKDANQIKAQQLLARVLLEPATQIAFAQKKGSIPVRLDLDTSSLDVCARKAAGWIADPNAQVPANEMLSPPALTGAMEDIISQYWNDPAMTPDAFVSRVASTLSQQF